VASGPEPGHVQVTAHAEPVHMGSLRGVDPAPLEPLCKAIRAGGLPCETTREIARDLWAKLLYNGLLNPLGAILGVSYGELGRSVHSREVMAQVAGEIFAVIQAAGHATHWKTPEDYLEDFYARLLPPTAAHESSMLLDLRAGGRTEIDAILGAVVREAEPHGIDVPTCRTLAEMVRFLESRPGARRPS